MRLSDRIAQANSLLVPYAVAHREISDRAESEPEDATRFPFQRDRDRIIHSDAFRRLKYKTQVFVSHFGDHFRTRLTHTIEVAQISRDMARTLRLNEDLAECIALAHDLGHTPFGHAGEEAMDECLQKFGKHFEHNEQSYRTCTALEERKPGVFGLNVNSEVLDGLLKHTTPHDKPHGDIPSLMHSPSLEAQVVNLADEIAYTAHDCEDGVRAGLFSADALRAVLPPVVKERMRTTTVRSALIDALVSDVYGETQRALQEANIGSLTDVYAAASPLVRFSTTMIHDLARVRGFLWNNMYLHPSVQEQTAKGKEILRSLFAHLMETSSPPIEALTARLGYDREDAVRDYVAGMTDGFAQRSVEGVA